MSHQISFFHIFSIYSKFHQNVYCLSTFSAAEGNTTTTERQWGRSLSGLGEAELRWFVERKAKRASATLKAADLTVRAESPPSHFRRKKDFWEGRKNRTEEGRWDDFVRFIYGVHVFCFGNYCRKFFGGFYSKTRSRSTAKKVQFDKNTHILSFLFPEKLHDHNFPLQLFLFPRWGPKNHA